MRKLIVNTFLPSTVSCRPRVVPRRIPRMGFEFGGWSANYWDEKMGHTTTGVMIGTYVPAGDIPTGSFALEEPTDAEMERRRNLEG